MLTNLLYEVEANEIWYYKVRSYNIVRGRKIYKNWSSAVKADIGMQRPGITIEKKVTASGDKYVSLHVSKCDGKYIQVYVGTNIKKLTQVKMPSNDWRKMKSTFNFRYSVGGRKMYFKIRSYGLYNNKKKHSPFSKIKGIKL